MLTDSRVKKIIAKGEACTVSDDTETRGQGRLYLRIQTTKKGPSASWFFQWYDLEGKKKRLRIGAAGNGGLTLKIAREQAETLSLDVQKGNDPRTEQERRKRDEITAKKRRESLGLTFGQFFLNSYLPEAKSYKQPKSWKQEDAFFRIWIRPVMGKKTLPEVDPADIKEIKKRMAEAGRAPRSIQYCVAVIRQIFNYAIEKDAFTGKNPAVEKRKTGKKKSKSEKINNARLRFLNPEESRILLDALKKRSTRLHNMAFLSLSTGLRAGEIFSLQWMDIHFTEKTISVRDTKNGEDRTAYMTQAVHDMLHSLYTGQKPNEYIFPTKDGGKSKTVSKAFAKTVKETGLNNGIDDPKMKIVFHTLRHSYASALAKSGMPLYRIQELMGHKSYAMVLRYAHNDKKQLAEAVSSIENFMN